jgi:hypothetical protein
MKRSLPALPVLLALSACAAQGDPDFREKEAFSRELEGRVAGETESCLPVRQSEGLNIVDRRTIVRRDGRTLWVNRLDSDCPGLRPFNTLIVETHGGQYCRGDLVRGLEPGTSIPGPSCPLRDWVPYRTPKR